MTLGGSCRLSFSSIPAASVAAAECVHDEEDEERKNSEPLAAELLLNSKWWRKQCLILFYAKPKNLKNIPEPEPRRTLDLCHMT